MADGNKHDSKSDGGSHGGGGHKKHHPHMHAEHEHEEGWIVSFADNVLLMMAFFVIMLALNMGPKGGGEGEESGGGMGASNERLLDLAIAVRAAFNNPLDIHSTDPDDALLVQRLRQRLEKVSTNRDAPEGESHSVQTVRPSDWTGDGALVPFSTNSSFLEPNARALVRQTADTVVGTHWMVEVRGHASQWEAWHDPRKARDLGYDRAWAVGQALVDCGLKWEQIRLVTCGDSAPAVARPASAEAGVSNQRVEIIVLGETAPPDPYSGAESD
ncbi:MAG: hypothetical protein DYG94_05190 [Leptolyngbya sp. PLA3]|nr:MAG: hypothetical protein EDM82_04935 [Cyanobacteria bacterium CYA]MCE7968129.1 hypothetical protein [Leptolyngbya sp. PL-A3]